MRIAERLDGRRVLITGVTGFVGEALLHRLLHDVPGPHPGRPGAPEGRAARPRPRSPALLAKPIFAESAERAGGVDALLGRHRGHRGRPHRPARPARTSTSSSHCAGDVSFDPPIQEAFDTNVLGVQALLQNGSRPSTTARAERGAPPVHYVHISTAYVGGRRRGPVPEGSLDHTVDWRAEAAAGTADGRAGRGRLALAQGAGAAAGPGRARPRPGRTAHRRDGRRAAPQDLGSRPAEARRPRAGPHAGLDRRLHVHQVDGRAGRRGARAGRRRAARRRGRSASCGRASSSPRCGRRTRGGSKASRWPSR